MRNIMEFIADVHVRAEGNGKAVKGIVWITDVEAIVWAVDKQNGEDVVWNYTKLDGFFNGTYTMDSGFAAGEFADRVTRHYQFVADRRQESHNRLAEHGRAL